MKFEMCILVLVVLTDCLKIGVSEYYGCKQKREEGYGHVKSLRYYFDNNTGKCSRFYFRNGPGLLVKSSGNHFKSMSQCKQVCNATNDLGRCGARLAQPCKQFWSYNSTTKKCFSTPAEYNGSANQNVFQSKIECQQECTNLTHKFSYAAMSPCNKTLVIGNGRGHSLRFFFNTTSRRCERFHYKGGAWSANHFDGIYQCIGHCNPGQHNHRCDERIPHIPPSSICNVTWYYHNGTNKCYQRRTTEGHNDINSFPTRDECELECVYTPNEKPPFPIIVQGGRN